MAKDIAKGRSVAERCARAQEAATFAVTHTTDIFASLEVEKPFLELAQTINVPLESEYRPGTVLDGSVQSWGAYTLCRTVDIAYGKAAALLRDSEAKCPVPEATQGDC